MSGHKSTHLPAVTGGKLHHVSASQVKTYRDCARKWWFQKVGQVPDSSPTGSRDLGTAVHAVLEGHLRGGGGPDSPAAPESPPTREQKIARGGLIHLPTPGPDLLVEHRMVPPLIVSGVPWEGAIDVVVPPGPENPLLAWVLDHKTTKNYRYCKTPGELATDVQLLSYAHWAALRFWGPSSLQRGTHSVRVSHVYYHTAPAAGEVPSKRVDGEIRTQDIPAQWAQVSATVDSMHQSAAVTDPGAVPGDLSQCNSYGGCPYRARCAALNPRKGIGTMLAKPPPPAPARPRLPMAPLASLAPTPAEYDRAPSEDSAPVSAEYATDILRPSIVEAAPPPHTMQLVLYIGCAPLVGPDAGRAAPLEGLVAEYSAPILAEYRTSDLRLIPYAEGKGRLAAALRARPPVGTYFVTRPSELTAVALEALTPLAAIVVQGFGGV